VFEIVNTGTAAAPQYASTVTTLANFNGSSSFPSSGLIIDANGDLFGSTIVPHQLTLDIFCINLVMRGPG